MGNFMSAGAVADVMGFLLSRSAECMGRELYSSRVVSRENLGLVEGEDDPMNNILSFEYVSGVWRVEVRLSDGTRTVVSSQESLKAAMVKALQTEINAEPA